jgi:hypothetical protein
MVPSDKGIIECRSVHRDVCEGVFREVQLKTSQQQVVGEVGGEVERRNHLGCDEREVM